jgi:hypothetical protein
MHQNCNKGKGFMSGDATKRQLNPKSEGFTVAVIRFKPDREDDGFGVLIHSGAQFHSSDDDTFTVKS